MSGSIMVAKDLLTDPRFTRLVRRYLTLSDAGASPSVTQAARAEITMLGGLAKLWIYADTHIRDDNTLQVTVDEVNELVGIEGFAQLLPADWFKVLDADDVQLPDFLEHNGTVARKNALHAARQARYRERQREADSDAARDATASRVVTRVTHAASPSHPFPSPPDPSLSKIPPNPPPRSVGGAGRLRQNGANPRSHGTSPRGRNRTRLREVVADLAGKAKS